MKKRIFFPILFFLGALVMMGGCTHSIHLSHVSDFSPTYNSYSQGTLIQTKTEQFVVLGFIFDSNYIDQAYYQLKDQCRKGNIQGIVTQYSTSHGFFSWTNEIEMQGLCVQ